MATRFALIAVLTVPLGLDLYMPVPEDNPITAEKIDQGRALFNDRRLSRGARRPARLTITRHNLDALKTAQP